MIRALLREPLLHFLAIGVSIFLWFQWTGGGSGPGSSRIVVSPGRIESLEAGFARTWQRPPTEAELKGLLDEFIREEIATREAMAMGLDRDDTIIRRRLRQKLDFLVEDMVDSVPPTDAELQAWLDEHPAVFQTEPAISFAQVYISPERRGESADDDARAILRRLESAGPGVAIDGLGDPTMLPPEVGAESKSGVGSLFGREFAERILEIEPGRWAGPIVSAYGLHVVFVRERFAGSMPGLDDVRPAVERDFLGDRRRKQLDAMYEQLLEKYTVRVERPEEKQESTGQ